MGECDGDKCQCLVVRNCLGCYLRAFFKTQTAWLNLEKRLERGRACRLMGKCG